MTRAGIFDRSNDKKMMKKPVNNSRQSLQNRNKQIPMTAWVSVSSLESTQTRGLNEKMPRQTTYGKETLQQRQNFEDQSVNPELSNISSSATVNLEGNAQIDEIKLPMQHSAIIKDPNASANKSNIQMQQHAEVNSAEQIYTTSPDSMFASIFRGSAPTTPAKTPSGEDADMSSINVYAISSCNTFTPYILLHHSFVGLQIAM